jgi:N-acetylneuraminate synthase
MVMKTKPSVEFVAEFTTNHMGNLNVLLRMVEKAAGAGASLIKMQKKDVEGFYTQEKLDSPFQSPYGQTYRDYRTIFEFDLEDHKKFDRKCKECGIRWFATAQDEASLDFLLQFNLPLYKVASCNAKKLDFISYIMRRTGQPLVISTGGTNLEDIDTLVNLVSDRPLFVLQCTSTYPCPEEDLHLGNIRELTKRYASEKHVTIGYSGHELGIEPSIVAAEIGAKMIERHFCLSRTSFVHHIECSLEPNEYDEMVKRVRGWEAGHAGMHPIRTQEWYDTITQTNFGMSESQKRFLVEGSYGTQFLGDKSEIK